MDPIKKLYKQSSSYFIGHILVMVAGFISFPIWTRVFTKSEYGMFALASITISLGVGFSKFGLQHAALRYYSDFEEKKDNLWLSSYYSTLIIGTVLICGAITLSLLLFSKTLMQNHLDEFFANLVTVIIVLIFIRSVNRVLMMFMRAEQRAVLYNIFSVSHRYGLLLCALAVYFIFERSLHGVLLGWSIAECAMVVILLSLYWSKIEIARSSIKILIEMLKYSFPLIWMEMASLILNFGDRYIIQYFIGPASVGLYSVAYNASFMAQSFLTVPMRLAVTPMYFSMWNREGEEKTKIFLSNVTKYYLMFGIPIVIGMSWFRKEIIVLLASTKFEESAVIIPYVIFSLILYGTYPIFSAGLRIQKKTTVLMFLTLFSGILNILLNILLIPKYGILGAAFATMISYVFLMTIMLAISNNILRVRIQFFPILKYLLLSIIIVIVISKISSNNLVEFILKFFLGVFLYLMGIASIEKGIRVNLAALVNGK